MQKDANGNTVIVGQIQLQEILDEVASIEERYGNDVLLSGSSRQGALSQA